MANPESEINKPTASDNASSVKKEVVLALIEHGSRPLAYVLLGIMIIGWLFAVRVEILSLLRNTQKLKLGSFELELRQGAASANVTSELKALETLTDEQLQLFLAIGNRKSDLVYSSPVVTKENLDALKKAGLLREVIEKGLGNYDWTISEAGVKLHDIIRRNILSSIRRSVIE